MSEWISVKDKMPELDENVLVFCDFDEGTDDDTLILIAFFDGVWWINYACDVIEKEYVTHWMPLPEPPKEETENE